MGAGRTQVGGMTARSWGGMFFSIIEDFSVVASLPNEIVPPVGHAPSPALIHSFGQTAATAS